MPRLTRASAAKEAASLSKAEEEKVQLSPILSALKEDLEEKSTPEGVSKHESRSKKSRSRARSVNKPVKAEDDPDELPHNLGKAFVPKNVEPNDEKDESIDEPSPKKRKRNSPKKTTTKAKELANVAITLDEPAAEKKKTVPKPINPHKLNTGVSPFPEWPHPTPEECQDVTDLLSTVHGMQAAPAAIPTPSLTVSGCGEVPSVLDAMIRTLLSAATTGANSSRAFKGLVDKFGILEEGIGKGSVNWDAVRQAPQPTVMNAIKNGGLAEMKSKNIQRILEMVYEENQARRDALIEVAKADPKGAENETPEQKNAEIARADQNVLSLDHLHSLGTHEAMLAMTRYPGIGPKTASCVLLFCMRRPSFAVDTHVFRLLKWLKWIPPQVRDEVTAFKHVDAVVPNHLKYALHQLFIKHGKACTRCKAATREGCEGWEEGCVIDHLVERTKKEHVKKGARDSKPKPEKSASRKKKAKVDESKQPNLSPKEENDSNSDEDMDIDNDAVKSANGLADRTKEQRVIKAAKSSKPNLEAGIESESDEDMYVDGDATESEFEVDT